MSVQPPHKVIHLSKIRMLSQSARPHNKIKITNVKSIKPPDPEVLKKQKAEKLRAQLQKEIVSRSKTCSNSDYWCGLPVVSGRLYCARHILQDSSAPYKHCAHTYGNGEHCPMPAPADREQALCFEHARAALNARQRSAVPPPPVVTTETLLNQLNHYVRPERTRTTSCASSVSVVSDPSEQDLAVPTAVDPFKQIDATTVNANYSSTIMECASASDSDCDSVTLGPEGNSRGNDEHITLDDSITELQPLWRAGVYTVEEAVREARDVHKALQAGYIGQMDRLRILLQTARQTYLKSLKTEREQYCSINSQSRNGPLTVKERKQLRKLKAYAGYHHKHGADAILARKLLRKRAKLNEFASGRPIPSQGRCTFTEGGVRCASHVLPAAKHCLKHVLYDQHQVLFLACGDPRGSESCREPVARLPLPSAACRYHTDPPAYTPFTLKKDDSEEESESRSLSSSATEDGIETFDETNSEITEAFVQPERL